MREEQCSRCCKWYPKAAMAYKHYCSDYCKNNEAWFEEQKRIKRHNHITRDIKPLGQCPGCDEYHNRNIPKVSK